VKVLDLFSGIGGFSLGLERAGMKTVAFCEISAKCRHLLNHHWPEVPAYDDICTLTADRLRADGIAVDAICGGFPCQDISFAGAGAGIEGERSGLWRHYARLIGELRPGVVIVENVAALTSRGLGVVLGDLALLGYDAEWDRIRAADVGAPHLRARLWIVAYARGEQHEGFGDAFRRALAAELPEAYRCNTGLRTRDDAEADAQHPHAHGLGSHRTEIDELRGAELRHEQERVTGSLGEHVADAARIIGHDGAAPKPRQHQGRRQQSARRDGAADVADASGLGRTSMVKPKRRGAALEGAATSVADPGVAAGWGWWSAEPDVGRVAHGVPARVDRLHGLGNAVVPEIPYRLGRAILAAQAQRAAA
jgi:DNA (cytosine-5)-methyltransferase 1